MFHSLQYLSSSSSRLSRCTSCCTTSGGHVFSPGGAPPTAPAKAWPFKSRRSSSKWRFRKLETPMALTTPEVKTPKRRSWKNLWEKTSKNYGTGGGRLWGKYQKKVVEVLMGCMVMGKMFLGRHTLHLDLPRDAWCFGFWESRRQSSRPPKTSAPQIKRKHHPKSSCFKHNLDFKRDFAPKTATFGELPSHKKQNTPDLHPSKMPRPCRTPLDTSSSCWACCHRDTPLAPRWSVGSGAPWAVHLLWLLGSATKSPLDPRRPTDAGLHRRLPGFLWNLTMSSSCWSEVGNQRWLEAAGNLYNMGHPFMRKKIGKIGSWMLPNGNWNLLNKCFPEIYMRT